MITLKKKDAGAVAIKCANAASLAVRSDGHHRLGACVGISSHADGTKPARTRASAPPRRQIILVERLVRVPLSLETRQAVDSECETLSSRQQYISRSKRLDVLDAQQCCACVQLVLPNRRPTSAPRAMCRVQPV